MTEITSMLEVGLEGHEQKQGVGFRVFCNCPQTTDAEGQTQGNGSLQRGKFCRSSWETNQKDEMLEEDWELL